MEANQESHLAVRDPLAALLCHLNFRLHGKAEAILGVDF
jgi:hypothetical protein